MQPRSKRWPVLTETCDLDAGALDPVAASGALQKVLLRLHRSVTFAVSEICYDEVELQSTARQIRAQSRSELDSLVLYFPQRLSNPGQGQAQAPSDQLGVNRATGRCDPGRSTAGSGGRRERCPEFRA